MAKSKIGSENNEIQKERMVNMTSSTTVARRVEKAAKRKEIAALLKQGQINTEGMDYETKKAVVDAVLKKHVYRFFWHLKKTFELLPIDEAQFVELMREWIDINVCDGTLQFACDKYEPDEEIEQLVRETLIGFIE